MARMRRGSVPVEYVLVVAGVAAIGMLGVIIPRGLGDMMMGGAEQMEVGGSGSDGNLSPFGQPASNGPGTPADDGVASPFDAPGENEGWADDPWAPPSPEDAPAGTQTPTGPSGDPSAPNGDTGNDPADPGQAEVAPPKGGTPSSTKNSCAPKVTKTQPKKLGTGCNQGKGNGAEGCDPGNSNQGDPTRSNDESGGTTRGRRR